MFGLLIDFVAGDTAEYLKDPGRQRFLADLLAQLRAVEAKFPQLPASLAILGLKDLHESAHPEFAGDLAMVHLEDCIGDLERVETGLRSALEVPEFSSRSAATAPRCLQKGEVASLQCHDPPPVSKKV